MATSAAAARSAPMSSAPMPAIAMSPDRDHGRREAAQERLSGRWLLVARALVVGASLLVLALFVAAIPVRLVQLGAPGEEVRAGLARLGLPLGAYATYHLALDFLVVLGFGGVAAVILRRKSDEAMGLFTAFALVTIGGLLPGTIETPARAQTGPRWPVEL